MPLLFEVGEVGEKQGENFAEVSKHINPIAVLTFFDGCEDDIHGFVEQSFGEYAQHVLFLRYTLNRSNCLLPFGVAG